MCGRYGLELTGQQLALLLHVDPALLTALEPRYNIAPTQQAPVLRLGPDGARALDLCRWGLIPSWARAKRPSRPLINARSETVDQKPSFRSAFAQRRCLVPADGFYEWRKVGTRKAPYHIGLRGRAPFAFAGLWESFRESPDAPPLETFTILTTTPNDLVAPIHDRMPVILAEEFYGAWLAPDSSPSSLGALLRPYPADAMEAWEVSTLVNGAGHDVPACREPLARLL